MPPARHCCSMCGSPDQHLSNRQLPEGILIGAHHGFHVGDVLDPMSELIRLSQGYKNEWCLAAAQ